ncbi:ABC-type transporter, periplasmic subunit [Mycoavidus cysteinexigens]|uniref:ABC-type transporter, periplasmic subunit n=1 Tax=Mycoavidus cysteinexigens TaxID=1553431 RepID=A0A2Z6EUH3_9BURK|nr:hypothetical protein [Mycoavidus cysteinexigens]BBE09100.1 ABC-type transporter, periplasmic subunit [Mycoavidus cysteinexigens]GAM52160.1 hypothetical protein EBME_0623 [bacterium endosymbiont of Mortierella elongata FMR23-6]GLR00235.1 hypothetical protein GCM10007934_00460 [Mycoavidus cysteinexigens]
MTESGLSNVSGNIPTQRIYHQTVDNHSASNDNTLSVINDQINRRIEEFGIFNKERFLQIENIIKDQNQIIKDLNQRISDLERSNKDLSANANANANASIKDNIMFSFGSPATYDLIYRTHGFYQNNSKDGRCAGKNEVMIEFVSSFPEKFTLDIKAHIPRLDWGIEQGIFEAHIGKLDEKRHKQEFQLVREGWRDEYAKDYATVLFETEDKDNNTIWIKLPESPYDETLKQYKPVGMRLYSLNFIPRK